MEKYKERAKEILTEIYDRDYRSNYKTEYPEQCIIEAMCQLAEEVEKDWISRNNRFEKCVLNGQLYTKEQVEELLQEQRELCAEKADIMYGFKYPESIVVDGSSILNAKLKLIKYGNI